MRSFLLPTATALLTLSAAACGPADTPGSDPAGDADAADRPSASTRPLGEVEADLADTGPEITPRDLAPRIELLAHDEMAGRAPGTEGGERASRWIAGEMERVGLEPMAGDDWFQTVPLVEATLRPGESALSVTGPEGTRTLDYPGEAVYWTKRLEPEVSVDASDIVFVGYGAVAPEYGWDDYAGVDARGKTVVMLVNDPGYATADPGLFNGEAMTYYGRWTYKFEEAGRQGADAAIVVHETAPASYGWEVVSNSWTGPQYDLERGPGADRRPALEGWITADAARALFQAAGLDFDELKAAAAEPGFEAAPLEGLTASGSLVTEISRRESPNVGGVVRGSERPDEVLLYTAHWDHLGTDTTAVDDGIYNGAVDNATGVAGILEIAEAMAARDTPPARSVLFLAVTAEESGLLGSEYFALNPTVPLDRVVAGINIDGVLPTGPSRDLVVVGYGASELEDELAAVAEPLGKRLTPDPNPEAGYFYRSDHISLAKRGVPMLYADAGEDLVEGGPEAGAAAAEAYRAGRYHAVGDEYSPAWRLDGLAELVRILHDVGEGLADSDRWPNWYEGNEFRSLRDSMRAGR
jgi:Zn-dependent M28 family amino/carboxypeptidase